MRVQSNEKEKRLTFARNYRAAAVLDYCPKCEKQKYLLPDETCCNPCYNKDRDDD